MKIYTLVFGAIGRFIIVCLSWFLIIALDLKVSMSGAMILPAILILPVWYSALRSITLKRRAWLWCKEEGIKPQRIDLKILKRGPLTYKTNSLQTVFNIKGNSKGKEVEVWLVFGSWFFGLLSRKFEVLTVEG